MKTNAKAFQPGALHNTITRKEAIAPPTWNDYKETRRLFDDFCIQANIPRFQCRYELIRWRTGIIKAYLDGLSA